MDTICVATPLVWSDAVHTDGPATLSHRIKTNSTPATQYFNIARMVGWLVFAELSDFIKHVSVFLSVFNMCNLHMLWMFWPRTCRKHDSILYNNMHNSIIFIIIIMMMTIHPIIIIIILIYYHIVVIRYWLLLLIALIPCVFGSNRWHKSCMSIMKIHVIIYKENFNAISGEIQTCTFPDRFKHILFLEICTKHI